MTTTWLKDDAGNRCSVEYFGSQEAAQKALDSLKNCRDCTDCSGCSGCSDCARCSGCSDCSRCSGCSYCSDCSYCSRCSYCSDCSDCSDLENAAPRGAPLTFTGSPAVPVIAGIHQRLLEAVTAKPTALKMSDWHTCGTVHCRAGWIVHLAGEAGYALERFHNTALAAQLIYRESGTPINPCRFYDSDEEAMADIRRCAGVVPEPAA